MLFKSRLVFLIDVFILIWTIRLLWSDYVSLLWLRCLPVIQRMDEPRESERAVAYIMSRSLVWGLFSAVVDKGVDQIRLLHQIWLLGMPASTVEASSLSFLTSSERSLHRRWASVHPALVHKTQDPSTDHRVVSRGSSIPVNPVFQNFAIRGIMSRGTISIWSYSQDNTWEDGECRVTRESWERKGRN